MQQANVEMDENKLKRLELAGWQTVTVEEFFELSIDEAAEVERRLQIQKNDTVS